MRYDPHLRPRSRSSLGKLIAATMIAVGLLGFDALSGGFLRASVRGAAAELASVTGRIGSSALLASVGTTKASLAAQNESLRSQLAAYASQAAQAAALQQENGELRALAHLAKERSGVTATVVSSGEASPYGTFLVRTDKGAGVHDGAVVLSGDGFAIGRVSDVQPDTALITELFAPGASLEVVLGNALLSLEGQGGGNARIKAPRSLAVAQGDVVRAPGLAGLPVGIVGHVESDPASAYKEVFVRVPQNLATLRFVYIERP